MTIANCDIAVAWHGLGKKRAREIGEGTIITREKKENKKWSNFSILV